MRHEKTEKILMLARILASSAEGLTLDEMAREVGESRRTVERMRDVLQRVFPQLEAVPDGATKRFCIPRGVDSFMQNPTTDELLELGKAIDGLKRDGAKVRARTLTALDTKIRAAMRSGMRKVGPDLEALLHAELIAVQAGPRPVEDDHVFRTIRAAVLSMKALRFIYDGGSRPGARRDVAPYGLIFGRTNYLIAADLGTTKPKHWRLDRIREIEYLDRDVTVPADFKLTEFASGSFGIFHTDPEDVVLHVLPHGMEEFKNWRFHPNQTVEQLSDGGALVRFRASGILELAQHLFVWGDKIEIVEPVSLRELMCTELRVALARHQEAPRYASTIGAKPG